MKINKVIIVINRTKSHADQTARVLKAFLEREKVSTARQGSNLII